MFKRSIIEELEKWAVKKDRKPLVLRGARQVGKTTAVNQFAKQYNQYLYLNLELKEDKAPFERFTNVQELVEALFFIKNNVFHKSRKTLIFIDEIQEVPEALNILRYFYEQAPEIHIIAADSLLETLFDRHLSYPVGRVEYMVMRPASFSEFLDAIEEHVALKQLKSTPFSAYAHDKLLRLYHTYAMIGGMPEIIKQYAKNRDFTSLASIYESLIVSYMDDVEKYASSSKQLHIIRHAIKASFAEACKRIKFEGFGQSSYGSREMGEALRALEKALLIQLVYPVTGFTLPVIPNLRKSPRLHVLDTGLLNYFAGLQKDILGTKDLNSVYNGSIIEHLAGQELLASQFNALSSLHFWIREKKTSSAEVDYVYIYDGKIIPIEIKSGSSGKLKSLHMFMDKAPHTMAIRFYAGDLHITDCITSSGKKFHLLNLPYFLVSQLENYLKWFELELKK